MITSEDPPQSEPIHLEFQIEEGDWLNALRIHYGAPPPIGEAAIVLLAIAMGYYFVNHGHSALSITLFIAAAFYAYTRFIHPRILFRSHRRFREGISLNFQADEIHFRAADVDSRLQWGIYKRATVTPALYLLYFEKNQFTIIPQRAFNNEDERARFEKLLTEKIPTITRRNR